MNGAGNKVGIEADPESSEQQDCFSCSTVISSKVSPDPRQTHGTGCVVSFYSSLFPCVPLSAWQVKRLLLRGGIKKVPRDYKDKSICFVNKPNADSMTYLLSAFMLQIRIHGELF